MLEVDSLCIQGPDFVLFQNLSLQVPPGEVLPLMGPSGCGKSTLLACISGVLPTAFSYSGSIRLNGLPLDNLPVEARRIGILFQDDLLFPHMTVAENLIFGIPARVPKKRRAQMAQAALEEVALDGFANRRVTTLSGGQKARISLMRTLLSNPKAMLLDEPFSQLDRELRTSFRELVFLKIRAMGVPTILVTHDEEDLPHLVEPIRLHVPEKKNVG
jgi:putative thiamine transport system ATP-binding protein